jgi:hypothetical protein
MSTTTLEAIDSASTTSTETTTINRNRGIEPAFTEADWNPELVNMYPTRFLQKKTIRYWDEQMKTYVTVSKRDFKKSPFYLAQMEKIAQLSTGYGGVSTIEDDEPVRVGTDASWDETDAADPVIDAEKSDVEVDPLEQERTEEQEEQDQKRIEEREKKQLLKEVKIAESDKRGLMLGMSTSAVAFYQNTRDLALQLDYAEAINGGAFSAFYTTLFGFIVMAFQQNGRFRYIRHRETHMTSEDHAAELAVNIFRRLQKKPVAADKVVNYVAKAIKNYSRPINEYYNTEKDKRDIHKEVGENYLNAIRGTGGGKRVGPAPTDAWDGSNYGFDPTDTGHDPESGLRHGDLRDLSGDDGSAEDDSTEESSSAPTTEKIVSREIIKARSQQLDEYIGKQKASDRRILMIVRDGKERTQGEVARTAGVSLATVKRVLHRAKKNLTQEAA